MKINNALIMLVILICLVCNALGQDTGAAATVNVNITNDYGYADGFGGSLNWYIQVSELKKVVYLGEFEIFSQKKLYADSGTGKNLLNKGRVYISDIIFVEGGVRNGWYTTDQYAKGSTYLKFGGGVVLDRKHYVYYNYGIDIHKYTDDGTNYLSNKGRAHAVYYDGFLSINKKVYGLLRINYTRGCNEQPPNYPNSNLGRFCGNFYNFGFGVGVKK